MNRRRDGPLCSGRFIRLYSGAFPGDQLNWTVDPDAAAVDGPVWTIVVEWNAVVGHGAGQFVLIGAPTEAPRPWDSFVEWLIDGTRDTLAAALEGEGEGAWGAGSRVDAMLLWGEVIEAAGVHYGTPSPGRC